MNQTINPENGQKAQNNVFFRGGFYWIALGAGILCAVVVWYSRVFSTLEGQYTFIGQNVLNALIIAAIAVQALIYRRQWDAMAQGLEIERKKTNPRLRIAEVTAENFRVGQRPFFVVTIANDGLLAATGVKIHMSIEIGDERPMDWIDDQVVTIPANGREHYFIHSSSWMTQEQLDSFEKSAVSLRVVGFFEYAPVGVTKFCYKYLPLQGEFRPAKIPQFVPCDFTPRLNTTLRIQGVHHKMTAGNVTLTVQRNPPEKARPEEDAAGSRENDQQ